MPLVICKGSPGRRKGSEKMSVDVSRLGPAAQHQVFEKLTSQGRNQVGGSNKKVSKYHAQKAQRVMPNGSTRTFDSLREAKRYDELALLLQAGAIRDLRLQQNFTLVEGYITAEGETVRPMVYKADFAYERPTEPDVTGTVHWLKVVEDVKGIRTDAYKLKKKLMLEKYGIIIQEV